MEDSLRFSLRKADKLLNSSDFSFVFDDASIKVSHPQFLILARANNLDHPRLGLVVAKKNIRLAVSRNRFKRLVRESFRLKQHNLPAYDAIVLARRGFEDLSNPECINILSGLWKRVAKRAAKLQSESSEKA